MLDLYDQLFCFVFVLVYLFIGLLRIFRVSFLSNFFFKRPLNICVKNYEDIIATMSYFFLSISADVVRRNPAATETKLRRIQLSSTGKFIIGIFVANF